MPLQQSTVPSADDATADDLIFLLSIVLSPERIIAELEKKQQQPTKQDGLRSNFARPSKDWQSVLATLPFHRRQIINSLQKLANAYQKWSQLSMDKQANNSAETLEEIDAIEKLEHIASNIREDINSYLNSIKYYNHELHLFWIKHVECNNSYDCISQLSQIGFKLSLQLIDQLNWDEKLTKNAITQLLNEELYTRNHETIIVHKLSTWAKAMSNMIQIDKSFWKFVEREVYDESELEHNSERPQLLNGEASSQIVDFDTFIKSTELKEVVDDGDPRTKSCDDVSIQQSLSLHESIVNSLSVEEAIQEFFNYSFSVYNGTHNTPKRAMKRTPITSILITGFEGCGKTHLLDTIQRQEQRRQQQSHIKKVGTARDHPSNRVRIIRPKYPVDLVESTIGSSEDRLLALFSYAYDVITTGSDSKYKKCLVMLDDVDKIFSLSNDDLHAKEWADSSTAVTNSAHYFVGRRCKSLFLDILDSLRDKDSIKSGHILLLCTSRIQCEEIISRFDKVFFKREPDDLQRREMILSCLAADCNVEKSAGNAEVTSDAIDKLLSQVVHHSTGKSASEISQCCRKALLACDKPSSFNDQISLILRRRLECLDNMIQNAPPPSLRGGSLDGVVDMKVLTPEELKSGILRDSDGEIFFPLFGSDAKRAFESLMNVVITPLCRSNDIAELLYGGNAVSSHGFNRAHMKPIRVGALLVGGPGAGKTSLAYHCASVAASISRCVTLLDVSCTSLIHKELGGSERAVHQLFSTVRAAAPCILLLDGIESIAPCRGNDNTSEGTMDRVLSMFLTEMDGIETGESAGNVAVIGITHDADLIDPALRRPGRLEKTIALGKPDLEARKELVMREINNMNLDFTSADYFDPKNEEDLSIFVAIESFDMSAVEVIAICKEASMECLREIGFDASDLTKPPSLRYQHFKSAVNKMKGRER
jgi:SpoVK/Ycf46/Vps4 family AAA+-type ATPase